MYGAYILIPRGYCSGLRVTLMRLANSLKRMELVENLVQCA